ncbi:MAG: insulinase family protein [Planctomycetes bacterium]|nr:insulinase family protein [Planctomycetota bacterium]
MSAIRPPLAALGGLVLSGAAMAADLSVPFEKHVLDNGLTVILHEDHSDPVVAVQIIYHVGSGREEVGRSGFAHLFEHLMFQGSEHVGDDQHFKLVSEAGGTLNGTTNRDRTNYFETLPSNQLELALWLEADRMGFLLPAITQEKLDNQREVVKNERRQNYENRPYGQADGRVMAALYPRDHSYNWLTIGSHEDLTAASLEDVVDFFQRWYGPNNATLAVGGDIDPARALALVEKWFGTIPRGPAVAAPTPRPVTLDQDRRLAMEDKVAVPELSFTWPTVALGDDDAVALDMLASVLSANRASLLDRVLMLDERLATSVTAGHQAGEIAGEFSISVRPAPDVSLDVLETRVRELLHQLMQDGVDADRLERLKARAEASMVRRLETVASRTGALAAASVFRGDAGKVTEDLERTLALTPSDVTRVLSRWVLDRPAVIMSVVPEGRLDMAARGTSGAQRESEAALDRASVPAPGPAPEFHSPPLWHDTLANGVTITGTVQGELPVVNLRIAIPGGHLRETLSTLGLSALTADLMSQGTGSLDAVGLTEALDGMGASLSVSSDDDEITLSLWTLTSHAAEAVALLGDVLIAPRMDPADFARLQEQQLTQLETRGDRINTVAGNVWRRLVHGEDTVMGWPHAGTLDTVSRLTLDDCKAFHRLALATEDARVSVVSDLGRQEVLDLLAPLVARWPEKAAVPVAMGERPEPERVAVYLVDRPGAPQSQIRVGHPSLRRDDPDYDAFVFMNYVLGGSFSSRINMNLREDKGYTYGARSSLTATDRFGTFAASSGVRTDVSAESVSEVMHELQGALAGFTDADASYVRDALTQAMTREYESVSARLSLVDTVSAYHLPDDYLESRQAKLRTLDRAELERVAREYVHPDRAVVLVVGDASVVREPLEALGLGPVTELDIDGNPVEPAARP